MNGKKDYEIMQKMYKGEEKRDASSKIRGFLFQDLIAVSKLSKEENRYVFLEYTEDITVITEEETYIIQAKYYPKKKVNMPEVIRELYYQYLRLEILGYKPIVRPVLAIHSNGIPSKPLLNELQGAKYINVDRKEKPEYPDNVELWLDECIYKESKENAQSKCFDKFAWNDSMEKFLKNLEIQSNYKIIDEYRDNVADQLNKLNFTGCPIKNTDYRKKILLGLAVQYIQEKYNEQEVNETAFEHKLIDRDSFVEYLELHVCTETEKSIGAYLHTVVLECWEQIIKNNSQITFEQSDMLEYIRDRTMDWIFNLVSEPNGQFRLLNTVSHRTFTDLKDYCAKDILERRDIICGHASMIQDFLKYFWKVMMNVNQNLLGVSMKHMDKEKLSPEYYIKEEEQQYLSLCFCDEKADTVVILSDIGNSQKGEKLTNIFGRMRKVQPGKWYLCGEYKGKYRYDLDVSEIKKGNRVSSMNANQFRIECMDCVKIDEECWHITERCRENIFLDKCIKCLEDGE